MDSSADLNGSQDWRRSRTAWITSCVDASGSMADNGKFVVVERRSGGILNELTTQPFLK